jgi:ubiquinol-cytochrome c reductase cytochrome b subunit
MDGSSNPLSVEDGFKVPFFPYMVVKDIFVFILYLMVFSYLVFFIPNYLGHPDNYIRANPTTTPEHIVPEWYFLPFYAILRAVPDKVLGVFAMIGSILMLFVLPLYKAIIQSGQYRSRYKVYFWYFVYNFFLLGWLGSQAIEYPFYQLSQLAAIFYFFYLGILIPYSLIFDSSADTRSYFFRKMYVLGFKIKKFLK